MAQYDSPPRLDARPSTDPPRGSLHKRLTQNSISNVSRHILMLGVAFFLTPFIVRSVGDASYGLWVVMLSFVGYAGILELGVQPAVVKLVGQYRGSGELGKLEELLSAAFVFFMTIGSLVAVFIAFLLPPLAPNLVKEVPGLDGLGLLFVFVGIDALILFLNYLFAGILFGAQLYHTKNIVDLTILVLYAALLVLFLPSGGLVVLAGAKVATDLLALIVTIIDGRRAMPDLHMGLSRLTADSFKELLSFGGRVFVVAITSRAATHSMPLIISSQLTAAATAFFAIPVRLVDYSRQISWALTMGFMPMFSELGGKKDHVAIRALYLRYSRYLLFLNLPILVLTFVHGVEFIAIWIGPDYAEQGGAALYLLTAAAMARGFQPLLWRLFIGLGHLDLMVVVSASTSLLGIVLAFFFVKPYGLAGAALAILVTTTIAQVVFVWHTSRYFELSVFGLLKEIHLRPFVVAGLYYGVALACARWLGQESYARIGLAALVSLCAYLPMAFVSLSLSERRGAMGFVRGKLAR